MSNLFRKDVLAEQKVRLQGEVSLAQPISFTLITLVLFAFVLVTALYLCFAQYTNKESVQGYLQPDQGVSVIRPKHSGVVSKLLVQEGQLVQNQQVIAEVSLLSESVDGLDLNQQTRQDLKSEAKRLNIELVEQQALLDIEQRKLKMQIATAKRQIKQLSLGQQTTLKRLEIKNKQWKNAHRLMTEGFLSEQSTDLLKEQQLSIEHQLNDIATDTSYYMEKQQQAILNQARLPIQFAQKRADIESKLTKIKQQIKQTQLRQRYQIKATRAGRVTNLLAKVGETISSQHAFVTILPKEITMEAILYIPTRAFGFVKTGQKTQLRYQAFPYQRFGLYEGEITNLSKAILLPADLNLPISLQEPVYKAVVSLSSQHISAYGAQVPLQPGMLLEADIFLEQRNLLQWLFDPFYSLKGRI
ncbi:HlyD family secretion protein [Thalassotalea aquiviva]|uniref:HlyD family secretion protein n=1 Tax=Thalassotalea aquiviva TaxID=3242415 RepID=UPI00352A6292